MRKTPPQVLKMFLDIITSSSIQAIIMKKKTLAFRNYFLIQHHILVAYCEDHVKWLE